MREEPFSVRGEESGQVDPRKTSTGSTPIFTARESWQCEKVHGSSQEKNTVGVNPKCRTQRAGLSSVATYPGGVEGAGLKTAPGAQGCSIASAAG